MKVMILANSSKGLYSFRNEVVLALLEKYEVVVSLPDDVCNKELEAEGCKIYHTDINRRGMNPLEDLKLIKEYEKLLDIEKPDLVLTYTIKPNIYGGYACRKKKIPYMVTMTGLGTAFEKEGLMKKLVVTMYKTGVKKAECIFFQNSSNMQTFEECNIHGKKAKLVKGSGVNLDAHSFEEYPEDEVTRFLYVGRVLKDKGIIELLAAAEKLHSDKVIFEIVGPCDDDSEELLNKAVAEKNIVWYGFQKDVNPYLKNCSALVLPSFYPEGISNVLMEASATGRPILTTNMPGCREVCEDKVTGFIFEPRSAQALVDALQKFLNLSKTEKAEMGKKARAKMENEFDRKIVVKDYMDEIERTLTK